MRNSNLKCINYTTLEIQQKTLHERLVHRKICFYTGQQGEMSIYRMSQKERSIFSEIIVSIFLSRKVYTRMYMCPIPNGFRGRAISLYSSKMFDKKKILRTVSDTSIYFSSDKVGTVYLVSYICENSTSTSMHFASRVRAWLAARLSAS
jgi:hypothetical protein